MLGLCASVFSITLSREHQWVFPKPNSKLISYPLIFRKLPLDSTCPKISKNERGDNNGENKNPHRIRRFARSRCSSSVGQGTESVECWRKLWRTCQSLGLTRRSFDLRRLRGPSIYMDVGLRYKFMHVIVSSMIKNTKNGYGTFKDAAKAPHTKSTNGESCKFTWSKFI